MSKDLPDGCNNIGLWFVDLYEVKVVHEVCCSHILSFLNPLQTFCPAPTFLGNGIQTVSITSPFLQNLADASRFRHPWTLHLTSDDIFDVGVLQHSLCHILAISLGLVKLFL